MISTLTSCSCTCFSGSKGQHLKSLLLDLLRCNKLNTFFVSNCEWSQPLPLVLVLVSAGQRVNICSRSCSDLLQGNKLNTFFVSNCQWSQPLPLVLVLVSAGQRVNIYSCSSSDLLQGNKLNTFFVFRLWMISTLTSCSCTYFSGPKGQHL
jgi:hypothetical protein